MTTLNMSDEEFLQQFSEAIGAPPDGITLDTPLSALETWDSVAYLAVMTLVDEKLGVALSPESLVAAQTPGEILAQARQG